MAWDKEIEAQRILQKTYRLESVMQADFFQWAINSYPVLSGYLWHIANENVATGKQGAIQGGLRMAMGVVAGVPDMECNLLYPDVRWAELKLPGGVLSPKQSALHEKWKKVGIEVTVVRFFPVWRQWIESIIIAKYGTLTPKI